MITLASQLLNLAREYPEMAETLDPVIASVISSCSQSRQARLVKAGRLKSIMGGSTIFGVKEIIANRIDRMLSAYELHPYAASLSFRNNEVSLLISCNQEEGREVLSNFACEYIAREIARDLKSALAYDVQGSGSYTTFSESALFKITQKLR